MKLKKKKNRRKMSYQIKNVNNKVEIVKRNQKKFEPEKYSN